MLVAWLAWGVSHVSAQPLAPPALPPGGGAQAVAGTSDEPALAPAAPLVLRPAPSLLALGRRLAPVLALRVGVPVSVGEPPPPIVVEALPVGHVALVEADARVRIVLVGPGGFTYATEVEPAELRGAAGVRALAFVVESLRESALAGPPRRAPRAEGSAPATRVSTRARLLLSTARATRDVRILIARPTIYLRLLLGVSPVRVTFLIGPGTGLGLCVRADCVVLEGDLPLIPEVRTIAGYETRYRFVNFSVRYQVRPFHLGDFTPGASFGVVTRIGTATLTETDTSRVVTNLGLRATAEIAWRFVPRFELVLEAGVDLSIDRAKFIRTTGETLILEDRWTPWIVSSVRLRP